MSPYFKTSAHWSSWLIFWGRALDWCCKSFKYISPPIKAIPHYRIGIWLSIEPEWTLPVIGWLTKTNEAQSWVGPPDKPVGPDPLYSTGYWLVYLTSLPCPLTSFLCSLSTLPPPPPSPRPGPWSFCLSSFYFSSKVWSSHISSIST